MPIAFPRKNCYNCFDNVKLAHLAFPHPNLLPLGEWIIPKGGYPKMCSKRRKLFSAIFVLLLITLACSLSTAPTPAPTAERPLSQPPTAEGHAQTLPPLYLTIIIHTEEDVSKGSQPKPSIPDYDGDQALMLHFTKALRAFTEMVNRHGAKINFGSDWTFSKGVQEFDPTFYAELENMGHEIDAHAHESFILYHQVREYIIQAGGDPSIVASGMNEQEIQQQLEYFDDQYPDFQILWGVSLPGHTPGECMASWAWKPSRGDWEQHDPAGRYIYIGPGEQVNSLAALESAIQNRRADLVNTYAIFLSPRELKAAPGAEGINPDWTTKPDSHDYWENRIQWWDDFLSEIDVWVAEGKVEYATLTQIGEIFSEAETRLSFEGNACPRSEDGLAARNRAVGYYP